MIIDDENKLREVSEIDSQDEKDILNFLLGAVYCWCKNKKGEWFSLRDLMGGDNYYWDHTPMIKLWEKHKKLGKIDPSIDAGKDGGWLLKKVIVNDARKYKTKKEELIRKYLWVE